MPGIVIGIVIQSASTCRTGSRTSLNRVTLLEDESRDLGGGYLRQPTGTNGRAGRKLEGTQTERKGLLLIALKLDKVGHCARYPAVRDQFYPWIITPAQI